MKKIQYIILLSLLLGCKEKYVSPYNSPAAGYLVVEGNIINGQDSTIITLSRTGALNDNSIHLESGAIVKVESEDNVFFTLNESSIGHYTKDALSLNANKKYRINIVTKDNKQYMSDFVEVHTNPAIDAVNWKIENQGVQFYINTHDPSGKSKYFQWDFSETFEFHSPYKSYLKINESTVGGKRNYSLAYRDSVHYSYDTSMFKCWKTEPSTNIILGSTASLSQDVIELPLTYIYPTSWKLSVYYSIKVKQYSLSKEAYEFLEKMKKNTEGTGSVFDAQPSELNGNIHNINDSKETVIGYINICNIQSKRIFIKNDALKDWTTTLPCNLKEIRNNSDSIYYDGGGLTPTDVAKSLLSIISFYAAPPSCVDCKLRGTSNKPSFWPEN
jgi:hypothetical protein